MTTRYMTYEDALQFGKYKNRTLESILSEDPRYLIWMDENLEDINIDREIIEDAQDEVSKY